MQEGRLDKATLNAYWNENKRLTVITLAVWAVVSYGAAYFATALDGAVVFGFPLGFYMAAQGAPVVFVLLAFNYARAMNAVDRKYHVQEEEE
jgi:putative solute:sodium symporter small subunit